MKKDMKKHFLIVLTSICMLLTCSLVVQPKIVKAESEYISEDGLWEFSTSFYRDENGKIVSYITLDKYLGSSSSVVVDDIMTCEIYQEQREFPVMGVSENCFTDNETLEKIVLPDQTRIISNSSFLNCTSLQSVTTKSGEFSNLTLIGNDAFKGCTNLTSFAFPENQFLYVGYRAFYGTGLSGEVTLHASYLGSNIFNESDITAVNLVLSDDVRCGSNVFDKFTTLQTLHIDQIEKIEKGFCRDCTALQSVEIGKGLKTIGENAFSGCSSLESVTVKEETGAGTLETIEKSAFSSCNKLKQLPDCSSLSNVGEYALMRCTAIESLPMKEIPESIVVGPYAFNGCKSLQTFPFEHVTQFSMRAFYECTGLDCEIEFNNEIKVLPQEVFWGCSNLRIKAWPNDLTTIDTSAFEGCTNLEIPEFPNKLEEIAVGSFKGCSKITSITLPQSLRVIGGEAFEGANISEIHYTTLPNIEAVDGRTILITPLYQKKRNELLKAIADGEVEDISKRCLLLGPVYLCPLDKGGYNPSEVVVPEGIRVLASYSIPSEVSKLTLPSTLKYIGQNALKDSYLTSIDLPDGLLGIGNMAFRSSRLTEIHLPDSVKVIGEQAFEDCDALKTIELPPNVEALRYSAFRYCDNLESIKLNDSIKVIEGGVFAQTKLKELHLPEGVEEFSTSGLEDTEITELSIPESVKRLNISSSTIDKITYTVVEGSNGEYYCQTNHAKTIRENADGILVREEDGQLYVIGRVGDGDTIKIPSSVSGLLVVGIDAGAFDCTGVSSIFIPASITSIASGAFDNIDAECVVSAPAGSYAEQWINDNGYTSSAFVPVTSIEIEEEYVSFVEGDKDTKIQLHAQVYPANATNSGIAWTAQSSASSKRVLVSKSGEVYLRDSEQHYGNGKSYAEYTVLATSQSNPDISATCTVRVYIKNKNIFPERITLKDTTLKAGEQITLEPMFTPDNTNVLDVVWKSSNEKVATVDHGVVTAISKGDAIITATSAVDDSIVGKSIITVKGAENDSSGEDNPANSDKDEPDEKTQSGTSDGSGNDTTSDISTQDGTGNNSQEYSENVVAKVRSFKITAKKKVLKLTWKKMSKIKGYQIQVSTKKNFKKKYTKKYTAKASAKSKTIKKLKSKKKYYVRIRAYKKVGRKTVYGAWVKASKKTK